MTATTRRFKTTLRRIPGKGGWTYVSVGFLPVPKRIRGDKEEGARVTIAFLFVDD